MSQLKEITCPKIGSLELDADDVLNIGPILPSWQDLRDQPNKDSWVLPGPFVSVHAFLSTIIAQRTACAPWTGSPDSAYSPSHVCTIPSRRLDGPPFVLSIPDFNFQNIFIAEDGRITCLIDWDGIEVLPIQNGYARYPSWITKDWDPWPHHLPTLLADQPPATSLEQLKEDSPSMLQKHREEYLVAYRFVDPTGSHYTHNSHVFEAIPKACTDWIRMDAILRQLSYYAFGTPDNPHFVTCTKILRTLPKGVWSRDYNRAAK